MNESFKSNDSNKNSFHKNILNKSYTCNAANEGSTSVKNNDSNGYGHPKISKLLN